MQQCIDISGWKKVQFDKWNLHNPLPLGPNQVYPYWASHTGNYNDGIYESTTSVYPTGFGPDTLAVINNYWQNITKVTDDWYPLPIEFKDFFIFPFTFRNLGNTDNQVGSIKIMKNDMNTPIPIQFPLISGAYFSDAFISTSAIVSESLKGSLEINYTTHENIGHYLDYINFYTESRYLLRLPQIPANWSPSCIYEIKDNYILVVPGNYTAGSEERFPAYIYKIEPSVDGAPIVTFIKSFNLWENVAGESALLWWYHVVFNGKRTDKTFYIQDGPNVGARIVAIDTTNEDFPVMWEKIYAHSSPLVIDGVSKYLIPYNQKESNGHVLPNGNFVIIYHASDTTASTGMTHFVVEELDRDTGTKVRSWATAFDDLTELTFSIPYSILQVSRDGRYIYLGTPEQVVTLNTVTGDYTVSIDTFAEHNASIDIYQTGFMDADGNLLLIGYGSYIMVLDSNLQYIYRYNTNGKIGWTDSFISLTEGEVFYINNQRGLSSLTFEEYNMPILWYLDRYDTLPTMIAQNADTGTILHSTTMTNSGRFGPYVQDFIDMGDGSVLGFDFDDINTTTAVNDDIILTRIYPDGTSTTYDTGLDLRISRVYGGHKRGNNVFMYVRGSLTTSQSTTLMIIKLDENLVAVDQLTVADSTNYAPMVNIEGTDNVYSVIATSGGDFLTRINESTLTKDIDLDIDVYLAAQGYDASGYMVSGITSYGDTAYIAYLTYGIPDGNYRNVLMSVDVPSMTITGHVEVDNPVSFGQELGGMSLAITNNTIVLVGVRSSQERWEVFGYNLDLTTAFATVFAPWPGTTGQVSYATPWGRGVVDRNGNVYFGLDTDSDIAMAGIAKFYWDTKTLSFTDLADSPIYGTYGGLSPALITYDT